MGDMPDRYEYRGIIASGNSRMHNGNVINNFYHYGTQPSHDLFDRVTAWSMDVEPSDGGSVLSDDDVSHETEALGNGAADSAKQTTIDVAFRIKDTDIAIDRTDPPKQDSRRTSLDKHGRHTPGLRSAGLTEQGRHHSSQYDSDSDSHSDKTVKQELKPLTGENIGVYGRSLIEAAKKGSLEQFKGYLKYDLPKDFVDSEGRTALHWAAIEGFDDIARILVKADSCSVDLESEKHGTALIQAVIANRISMVRILVEAGANANASHWKYGSAFHEASYLDRHEIVKIFLDSGAEADKLSFCQMNRSDEHPVFLACRPLFLAAWNNRVQMAKFLLSTGADVNADCAISNTLSKRNHESWDQLPKDLDPKTEILQPIHQCALSGHSRLMKTLIERGALVDGKIDISGEAPIHMVVDGNHKECLEVILAHGAATDVEDSNGWLPLTLAAGLGNLNCLKILLGYGAFIDGLSKPGRTALAQAVWEGRTDCVRLLLARGASPHIVDRDGHLALHLAASSGHARCLELLLHSGTPIDSLDGQNTWTALMEAVGKGHADCVNILIRCGASVRIKNRGGCSALHIAAEYDRLESVKILLENGALIEDLDEVGWTPIMLAANYGHADCVEFLLSKGADPSSKDSKGSTALHVADNEACVKLLIRHGAMRTVHSQDGITPLIHAVYSGKTTVVEAMLDLGVPIHDTNSRGFNAYDHAVAKKDEEVIALLKSRGGKTSEKKESLGGRTSEKKEGLDGKTPEKKEGLGGKTSEKKERGGGKPFKRKAWGLFVSAHRSR